MEVMEMHSIRLRLDARRRTIGCLYCAGPCRASAGGQLGGFNRCATHPRSWVPVWVLRTGLALSAVMMMPWPPGGGLVPRPETFAASRPTLRGR